MKYVKLTAKPNTFYKENSEVFDYDSDYCDKKRITLGDYEEWKKSNSILVRGIIIDEKGEEWVDGEFCHIDEFNMEIVDG